MIIITENDPVISALNFWLLYQTANKQYKRLTERKINGENTDGKICFREDIDAFIRMHKLINLQNNGNNELKWFQLQSEPEGFGEIPENILREFSLILLEGRDNACNKRITLGS